MSAVHHQPITSAAAWKGRELLDQNDWLDTLGPHDIAEIDQALRHVRTRGLAMGEIGKADFPLPRLAARLAQWSEEIANGRGFVVLRGFPALRYSDEDAGTIFYGLGTWLGLPVTQNPQGELLGHVKDFGQTFGKINVRGYQTKAHLPFHTDRCDIVGLMCLRRAKAGGESSIVSALAVHNAMLKSHPDYLAPLYEGFHYINREAALGDSPVTPHRVPVFGAVDGIVSCRYIRAQIEAAAEKLQQPLTELQRDALDELDALTRSEELRLDMDLQVGDIQLCNNYTVLHSRTDFEDFEEPERKRHMLRLWLTAPERRPLPADFPQHNGYGSSQVAEVSFAS